jgi:hypothetical protein
MRCCHTTACGNDGKTKLISAGQSGAIELFTALKSQRMKCYETKSVN